MYLQIPILAMSHLYSYEAQLLNVVDGDTYDFQVDLGFNTYKRLRVRLLEVDTAEIYGVKMESKEYKRGQRQKEFVSDNLNSADKIVLKTYEGEETGKYGRYLAEVFVDDKSLSDLLIDNFEELSSTEKQSYGLLIEDKKGK